MTPRPWRVVFTACALAQADASTAWWRRERPAAPDLFGVEFAAAIERLARLPGSGAPFQARYVAGVRRILMPGCRYHVYYTLRRDAREVIVRAVWHAMRGAEPDLS